MSKKLLPTVLALTLPLANCSQPGASSTPAPPDTPVEGTISVIQLYRFGNAEMAVAALPAIRTEQEQGGKGQMGSVPIVGDTVTQEGRFVKLEGALPIEDLSRMFE